MVADDKWEHIKSGVIYFRLWGCTNKSSNSDGQPMIAYQSSEGRLYVRSEKEFRLKFKQIID